MQAQSLKTETIDDYTIITGFQNRPIDPRETQKQSASEILASDEMIALRAKQEDQDRFMIKLGEARKKSVYHLSLVDDDNDVTKNKKASENQDKIAEGLVGTLNVVNEELKPLAVAVVEKTKDILRSNPVFFDEAVDPETGNLAGPRKDEVIKTERELNDLLTKFSAKTENQVLIEEGSYIDDFRGKVFYKKTSGKWIRTTIENLNVKKTTGSKFDDELTESEKTEVDEQEEVVRIDGLTSEEKTAEYDSANESLLSESINLRNKLEIQGKTAAKALADSQTFYNTELDKLKSKYGVA